MSTDICVHLYSENKVLVETINFFEAASDSPDVEQELIGKIQDLFSVIRNQCKSLSLVIELEVKDMNEALFLIRRKMKKEVVINHQKLSIREIEVLGLIMQGFTNHEIAEKLFISYETVRSHRKNILEKTGAKNTASLINYYHRTFFEK